MSSVHVSRRGNHARLGLFTQGKVIHGCQHLGRFCCRLKYGLRIPSRKLLIPVGDVRGGIAFRHGQIEPRSCQHGEHFRPHFFKGVIFERFPLIVFAMLPLLMTCGMIRFVELGGIVFF